MTQTGGGSIPFLSGVAESSKGDASRFMRVLEKLGVNGFMLMPAMM
jgi:hypothetical protein